MLQYTVLDRFKRPFVIYKDVILNQVCLDPSIGINKKHKTMIISLPRAGSHMLQEMLLNMGLHHVRLSFDKDNLYDYRFLSDNDRIKFVRTHDTYSFALSESIKWLINGQFVHNHLSYDNTVEKILKDSNINIFILKRNLRDCVVSHARYKQKEIQKIIGDPIKLMEMYITSKHANEFVNMTKLILPWFEKKIFPIVAFEDLYGTNGKAKQYETLNPIVETLQIKYVQMDQILEESIRVKTFSFSGAISDWTKYWSPNVEEWFIKSGCYKMNNILGYEKVIIV